MVVFRHKDGARCYRPQTKEAIMTVFGYSEATLARKAAKRGISRDEYVAYLAFAKVPAKPEKA